MSDTSDDQQRPERDEDREWHVTRVLPEDARHHDEPITVASQSSARVLSRFVDAALDYPTRQRGVSLGRVASPNKVFTWRYGAPVERAGKWMYPCESWTRHLVARHMLHSPELSDRARIVRESRFDDTKHWRAGYLCGVMRRALSDVEPRLYQELDLLALSYTGDSCHAWLASTHGEETMGALAFADEFGVHPTTTGSAVELATDALRQLDRHTWEGKKWFAVPVVYDGPATAQVCLMGLPNEILESVPQVFGRPEVSELFGNIIEATAVVAAANAVRYVDREHLLSSEARSLAPPLIVAHAMLSVLISGSEEDPPTEHLTKLFERIARTPYEGRAVDGGLVLGPEGALEFGARLREPVEFSDVKLLRKVLEANGPGCVPVGLPSGILGFGAPESPSPALCTHISFHPKAVWSVGQLGGPTLFSIQHGALRAPKEEYQQEFERALTAAFGDSVGLQPLIRVFEAAREQAHGTMLVIRHDAAAEAARRSKHMTLRLQEGPLDASMVLSLSSMDGALLFDTEARCFGAGLIVDGSTGALTEEFGDRSRGARFNSAVGYWQLCESKKWPVVVAVLSEDGYCNIFGSEATG